MTKGDELPLWWIKERVIDHLRDLGNEESLERLRGISLNDLLLDLIGYARMKGYNEAILHMKNDLEDKKIKDICDGWGSD